jgi:hypothetical protein
LCAETYVLLQLSQIFLNKNNATYLHCANQCSIGKVDMPYVVEDFSNFLSKMALKLTLLVSTPVTIDTGLPYPRFVNIFGKIRNK